MGPVDPANPDDPTQPTKEEQLKELQKTMLENTLAMQQRNKDTIGWIYIDDTTVNDVVVKVNYNDDNKYTCAATPMVRTITTAATMPISAAPAAIAPPSRRIPSSTATIWAGPKMPC